MIYGLCIIFGVCLGFLIAAIASARKFAELEEIIQLLLDNNDSLRRQYQWEIQKRQNRRTWDALGN